MTQRIANFVKAVWQEIEPIAIHACVFIFLQLVLLLSVLMTSILKKNLSDHETLFLWIEKVELWFFVALFSIFAFCTILRICIRLFNGLREETPGAAVVLEGGGRQ